MPGKIIEQILLEDKSKPMEGNEVVGDNQNDFTKGKSRMTSLVACYGVTA